MAWQMGQIWSHLLAAAQLGVGHASGVLAAVCQRGRGGFGVAAARGAERRWRQEEQDRISEGEGAHGARSRSGAFTPVTALQRGHRRLQTSGCAHMRLLRASPASGLGLWRARVQEEPAVVRCVYKLAPAAQDSHKQRRARRQHAQRARQSRADARTHNGGLTSSAHAQASDLKGTARHNPSGGSRPPRCVPPRRQMQGGILAM